MTKFIRTFQDTKERAGTNPAQPDECSNLDLRRQFFEARTTRERIQELVARG
jgi:hypothetical protein